MILLLLTVVPVAAFSPWARNDTNAYIFKTHVDGVLEKRRRKLDALRRKGGDAIIRDAVVPLSPSERLANAPAALKLSPSVISFSSAKEICDVFEYPFSIEGKLYSPMVDWCATKKSVRREQWLGDGVSAEDVKRNEDNFDNRKKAYCAIQLLDKYDPADATPKPRFSTDVGYDSKEVGPSGTKGGKETWSTWDKLTCELVEAARRRSGALPAEA